MKQHSRTFACGSVVALAMVLGACTERETMASKSAEAYREAQAKGVAPSSEGGHGHGAAKAGHTTAAPDHSAHGTDGAATNTAMDHGAHGATDHAAHGPTVVSHGASNKHGTSHTAHAAQGKNTDHAAMHSTAQAGGGAMQHGTAQPMPLRVEAPSSSSEMAAVRPDATLRPDDFDMPARISVAEAAKAIGRSTSHDAVPAVDPSGATIYTCPMHPEVTSTTPGTCPKCGMTLVERKKK